MVNDLGQYEHSMVLLTPEEEQAVIPKRTHCYSTGDKVVKVTWPCKVRNGDIINEVRESLDRWSEWVASQTRACQIDQKLWKGIADNDHGLFQQVCKC